MNRRRLLELVHTGEYDCWDIVLGNVMQALMAVYINRRLPNSYIMKAATACNKGDYRTAIGLFWNGIIVDLSKQITVKKNFIVQ